MIIKSESSIVKEVEHEIAVIFIDSTYTVDINMISGVAKPKKVLGKHSVLKVRLSEDTTLIFSEEEARMLNKVIYDGIVVSKMESK